jgi:hypothetical protein
LDLSSTVTRAIDVPIDGASTMQVPGNMELL